jgi:HD-GYP domain-containing protein (c-di-GMP phosphodiesterase class II)
LGSGFSDPTVGLGELSEVPPKVSRRHAALFLEAERLRRNNHQLNEVNDSLTHAVAGCYEELIFLRDLAAHFNLEAGSADTIRGLLPQLSATLRVESLAMISNFVPVDDQRRAEAEMLPTEVLWSENALLDDHRCLRLLSEFIEQGHAELAIQNEFYDHSLAPEYPEVREFLLMRVGQASAGRWLLAVNRILDDRSKRQRYRASEKELGTNEATLLSSAAAFLATHFQNLDLLRQKDEMFMEIVRALVNALEARDPYTSGHSERVARYAKRLAEQIGLDEEGCELVHLSGLLHDVGKLGVNDAILRKEGQLNDAEFLQISRHPDLGREILHDLSHLRNVLPGVLYHHERYDGEGYPDQLAGEAIPLEGRLLAICDAYDAMTSDRPYRDGMPQERAESILRGGAGVQWDPAFVDAFFTAMPDILRIRTECNRTAANKTTSSDKQVCVEAASSAADVAAVETNTR